MRLVELKELIEKKKIFGQPTSVIFSIEFQKRGLPHVHMVVTLAEPVSTKCNLVIQDPP